MPKSGCNPLTAGIGIAERGRSTHNIKDEVRLRSKGLDHVRRVQGNIGMFINYAKRTELVRLFVCPIEPDKANLNFSPTNVTPTSSVRCR